MKTKPNDNTPARDFNRANSYKSALLLSRSAWSAPYTGDHTKWGSGLQSAGRDSSRESVERSVTNSMDDED